ncbi:hypothetical protein LZ31DRAFT_559900 [Colletotrichum somersetense]|nr:hypothetical protein LZ31DRAFT_559900 [Colletotrichum somersetense]
MSQQQSFDYYQLPQMPQSMVGSNSEINTFLDPSTLLSRLTRHIAVRSRPETHFTCHNFKRKTYN